METINHVINILNVDSFKSNFCGFSYTLFEVNLCTLYENTEHARTFRVIRCFTVWHNLCNGNVCLVGTLNPAY